MKRALQRLVQDPLAQKILKGEVLPLVGDFFAGLFSTHPPVEDPIRRLRGMTP